VNRDKKSGGKNLSEQYYATFDPISEPVSDAVVSSLSEATETDPDAMEPIESVIDPIVFDALVRRGRRPIRLSFVYHEHHVTVDTGGEIWIRNSETAGQSEFECSFDADESPSHGVVRAIAAVKGVEPTGVDPLYDFIDPDALDAMFDGTTGTSERDIRVSFRIDDLEIEVSGDRRITVHSTTTVA
jgi:hypothetical protein